MSLESIIEKIINDANENALSVKNEALNKAKQIEKQATQDAEALKMQIISQAEKDAQINADRIISSTRLECRKQELDAMQKTINKCFDLAVEKLVNLPDDEYQRLIDKMVKSVDGNESMELVQIPKEKKGGFLLKKGEITLNFSFDMLSKSLKEKLQQQVVEILGW